jgi:hypothetical protein
VTASFNVGQAFGGVGLAHSDFFHDGTKPCRRSVKALQCGRISPYGRVSLWRLDDGFVGVWSSNRDELEAVLFLSLAWVSAPGDPERLPVEPSWSPERAMCAGMNRGPG